MEVFRAASDLSPKKQQIYFEIADIYLQNGDYNSAISDLNKAFLLDPEFDQARLNLAVAYILSGNQDAADRILLDGFGTINFPRQILVQVYSRIKNYTRLAGIWDAFVKNDPSLENYKNLVGAYLLANDNQEALEVLESAVQIFPEFKDEGNQLIIQIKSGAK